VLRLKSGNRLKVGEGVSGVKSRSFGAVAFKSHIFRNDGVDWSGVLFWREEFSSFGILNYKYGLENG